MHTMPTLHFGPFHLEGTDGGLWHGSHRCKLKAKAVAVLRYLVEHPGRVVRKADLMAAVWPDVHVSDWVLPPASARFAMYSAMLPRPRGTLRRCIGRGIGLSRQ